MGKVYTNQPITLDIIFTDQNSTVIPLSGATVSAELFTPSNRTGVASSTVSGSIVLASAGTAMITIPVDTLDEVGQWRVQAIATISGTAWPAEVDDIEVTERGSLN